MPLRERKASVGLIFSLPSQSHIARDEVVSAGKEEKRSSARHPPDPLRRRHQRRLRRDVVVGVGRRSTLHVRRRMRSRPLRSSLRAQGCRPLGK